MKPLACAILEFSELKKSQSRKIFAQFSFNLPSSFV